MKGCRIDVVMTDDEKVLRTYEGSTAIVTGGASGIGRSLSEELALRGSEVIVADLQIEQAREVVSGIQQRGGKADAADLDVTDHAAVDSLLVATMTWTGRLDFMFNNAGIAIGGPAELHSVEDWQRVLDVNVRGVVNGVESSYRIMREQGFGHIVNTASMAGLLPLPGGASYSASKHAVVGLSRSLRIEGASIGVRVSVLCPGVVRTAILEDAGAYGKMLVNVPPGRMRELAARLRPIEPDVFASRVLDHVARNRAIIVVPGWWRIFWWFDRFHSGIGSLLGKSIFDGMRREFGG